MPRDITLRQIEAFKAVIEIGTVSRAADLLNISQSAMSKVIAHLELDTGLKLFNREKGRLTPTDHAIRLYHEVGHIFSGIRQVQNTVDAIRREGQGKLAVGVMPALSGSFIQRAMTGFLKDRSSLFCDIQSLSSQAIVNCLIARKLDIGLIQARLENAHTVGEPLMEQPLVCAMPRDHPLAAKNLIKPDDLNGVKFIAFDPESELGSVVEKVLETYRVGPQIVFRSNAALTICQLVAAGFGISLVHPLMLSGFERNLVARRFEPEIGYNFQLCRSIDCKNAQLVDAFADQVRILATHISTSMLDGQ